MPPAARSRARWTPARSPCSGSRPPPRRTGASASCRAQQARPRRQPLQTAAARPRRRLAATQDADARPPSPSAMSEMSASVGSVSSLVSTDVTEPAGRPTGACWSGAATSVPRALTTERGACWSAAATSVPRAFDGDGGIEAAVRSDLVGHGGGRSRTARASRSRRRRRRALPCVRPDMTTSFGPRWRCAMLGGAAIRSLSVGHHVARVPHPRPARGPRLRRARPPRRPAPARGAGDPAAERQPRRLDRPAGRPALRRRAAGDRRHAGPAPDLRPAQGPRPGDRDAAARLPRPRRSGACSTSAGSSGWPRRARPRSRATSASARPSACGTALALWRGPPLADLAYEPFAAAPIARLDELRLTASRRASRPSWASASIAGSSPSSRRSWTSNPTHERFRAQLMTALYRSGRQEDALATYRALRRELVEAFGIEPTPELVRLEQAVLNQDPALDAPAPPAAARPPRVAGACWSPRARRRRSRRSPRSRRRWRARRASCC